VRSADLTGELSGWIDVMVPPFTPIVSDTLCSCGEAVDCHDNGR
jgi:hypothetical protein